MSLIDGYFVLTKTLEPKQQKFYKRPSNSKGPIINDDH